MQDLMPDIQRARPCEVRPEALAEDRRLAEELSALLQNNARLQESYGQVRQEKAHLEETLKGTLVRTATVEADNAELREFVGSLVTRIASLESQLETRGIDVAGPFSPRQQQQGTLLDAANGAANIAAAARVAVPKPQLQPQQVQQPRGGGRGGRSALERPPLAVHR